MITPSGEETKLMIPQDTYHHREKVKMKVKMKLKMKVKMKVKMSENE